MSFCHQITSITITGRQKNVLGSYNSNSFMIVKVCACITPSFTIEVQPLTIINRSLYILQLITGLIIQFSCVCVIITLEWKTNMQQTMSPIPKVEKLHSSPHIFSSYLIRKSEYRLPSM
jgi:hypothetical protein